MMLTHLPVIAAGELGLLTRGLNFQVPGRKWRR